MLLPFVHPPSHAFRYAALLAAGLAAAACAERGAPTATPPVPDGAGLAALTCEASIAAGTVSCHAASTGGALGDVRTVGGQGSYVRMASSNVAYAAGVFSFDATVQNLANLAMATDDGATPHADGVRVFLLADPQPVTGTGPITVGNATSTAFFTAAGQSYFQYGGEIGGVPQGELGGDGILASAEASTALNWQFDVPATVTTFTFSVGVRTHTATGTLASVAPQVASVSPATLVPGEAATLTGTGFSPSFANNTVTVGGVAATVTGATATTLDIVVPCVASGNADVQVTQGGMTGVALSHPVQANTHTLAVGQAAIVTDAADVGCNELPSANGNARYVVAVYNTSGSPTSSTSFQIAGDPLAPPAAGPLHAAAPAPLARPDVPPALALLQAQDDAHTRILEMNRRLYEELRPRFAADPRMRPSYQVLAAPVPPPATRTFHVANIFGAGACNNFYTVNATQVYHSGRVAIYEDDANPVHSSTNPSLAAYYQAIGDQYNADMDPIVTANFGDVLRRDASTDNNGVMVMLFTTVINTNFPGVAGFVISCDQFPNDSLSGSPVNRSSNFGEYFYAYVPTDAGTGYDALTPDSWYRTIRSTVIHETKHVVSQAARVANGAPTYEASWLEEGTARHAEELWARTSIYNVAWKGNTGYGSAADYNGIYCDVRPTTANCSAANPRRPSLNMWRHFSSLYTFLGNSRILSPFGSSPSDNASYFYATSWSLARYAIDRYGTSDADFLGALTQSTTSGITNLTGRAGVGIEELMGGWALALYLDDHASIGSPTATIDMPTWDFPNIYAGLKTDFPTTYTRAYHVVPTALSFGSFAPVSASGLVGGGVVYYELSGTMSAPQLIQLTGAGGGALPSTLRVAIARIE